MDKFVAVLANIYKSASQVGLQLKAFSFLCDACEFLALFVEKFQDHSQDLKYSKQSLYLTEYFYCTKRIELCPCNTITLRDVEQLLFNDVSKSHSNRALSGRFNLLKSSRSSRNTQTSGKPSDLEKLLISPLNRSRKVWRNQVSSGCCKMYFFVKLGLRVTPLMHATPRSSGNLSRKPSSDWLSAGSNVVASESMIFVFEFISKPFAYSSKRNFLSAFFHSSSCVGCILCRLVLCFCV